VNTTIPDETRVRAFVMAADEEQDLMRACALLSVGKPGLRQERFVVERLMTLEQRGLVFFDRGGYWLSPTGKEARDVYLATARALLRRSR
jgi:hypothetical protein